MEQNTSQLNPYEKKFRILTIGKRLCAGAVIFGFVTSAGGNILHAVEEFAGRPWGTLIIATILAAGTPTIFGIMFEIASRIFFRREANIVMKLIAFLGAAGISGITAWNSYFHQRDAFKHFGDATQASLLPLAIDGLMVIGSVYLLEVGFQIRDLEALQAGIKTRETRVAEKKAQEKLSGRDRVAQTYARFPGLPIKELAARSNVSYNYAHGIAKELAAAPTNGHVAITTD